MGVVIAGVGQHLPEIRSKEAALAAPNLSSSGASAVDAHAPQQLPNCLTLEQQAPISSGATFLGGATEELLG